MLAPLLLTATVLVARVKAFRRQGSAPQIVLYVIALLLQHLTVAAIATSLACIAPMLWPIGGLLCGLYTLLVAGDTAMFLGSGFRLERRLVAMFNDLKELAEGKPVRTMITIGAVATVAMMVLGGWAWAGADAGHGWAQVEVLAAACVAYGISHSIMRTLPGAFTYGWDNIVIFHLRLGAYGLRGKLRDKTLTPVPQWFYSQHEESTVVDPDYPLFRTTHRFNGLPHFTVTKNTGEKPHVVILMLESFAARDVGVLGGKYKVSPNLDAIAHDGVLWTNFHANATITSRSGLAALYGTIAPLSYVKLQDEAPARLRGLPHIFRDLGYRTAFMQCGMTEWEDARNFFLTRGGFEQMFGQEILRIVNPGTPASAWSFDDKLLFDFHRKWLKTQDEAGVPTFSCVQTITTHAPYNAPDGAAVPEHDLSPNSDYARYLQTVLYTDKCLGEYMERLRADGLDKKTIFYIHGRPRQRHRRR